MVTLPIYLDNNATTRTDPRVLEAMLPFFSEHYGNAASHSHAFGHKAAEAVERARQQVAQLLCATDREIYFTSGATESNNLAIKGLARMARSKGNHLVTLAIEHRAVLDPCRRLEREGFEVTYLPVDAFGRVDADQVAAALTDRTILVSVMLANNEIGTIEPIADVGRLCHERGIVFHTDATQGVGKIPVDVQAMGVDLLSLSAHKFYGPKGVGALYVRRQGPRVRLDPMVDGGGHERGLRSGTVPVPLVVGLGAACDLARQEMPTEAARIRQLRDRLEQTILAQLDGVRLNGHPTDRVPGTCNLSFAQVEGEALMLAMQDVAVSAGSACSSAEAEPSYVVTAIGLSDELAHASIRFSIGRFNTLEEIDYAAAQVIATVQELRRYASTLAAPLGGVS
jgi:cysteine desulfurase